MSTLNFDELYADYFNDAKYFFEKASNSEREGNNDNCARYCRASLLLGFSALEALINAVIDEFTTHYQDLTLHEKAFLNEVEILLSKDGVFELTSKPKYSRIEDRILFIHQKFSGGEFFDRTSSVWSTLQNSIKTRNSIVHPKSVETITVRMLKNSLDSILEIMDMLFRGIYRTKLPMKGRGLQHK